MAKIKALFIIVILLFCPDNVFAEDTKDVSRQYFINKEKIEVLLDKAKDKSQFRGTSASDKVYKDIPDVFSPVVEEKTFSGKIREKVSKAFEEKAPFRFPKKAKTEKKSEYLQPKKIKKRSYGSVKKENNMPKTFEAYVELSKDIKRSERKVPPAVVPADEKIVNLPPPSMRIVKYNNPPGSPELDLRQLMQRHQLVTTGVLSPDNKRLVYSVVYSYPTAEQVASEIFVYNVPKGLSPMEAFTTSHTINSERIPIVKSGTDRFFQYEKRTLTVVDWSEDGQKVAIKEKLGSQTKGPWLTNLIVYDFQEQKQYDLTAVREAIRYFWRKNQKLDLIDFMWDIYPIGWDLYNKDRIIVYAYVYGKNHDGALFLGAWSIDYKNERSELMSLENINFEVSVNGSVLKLSKE